MATKKRLPKPFEKGHLKSNMVHMSDLTPEARKKAGIKARRNARLRHQPPVVVSLNWKSPNG